MPHRLLRRTLLLVLWLTLLLVMSGCWDRQEIENTAFVLAMGIDKAEPPDVYKLTMQISIPSQVTGNPSPSQEQRPTNWVVTSTGTTIFEAVRNLSHQVPRQPLWFNLRLVAFGEEFARDEGIGQVVDFLARDSEPRRRVLLFVSKGVPASEVMRAVVPTSVLAVEAIEDMMNISTARTGTIVRRTLYDVLQTLSAPGWEVHMSPIEILTEKESTADQGQLPQGVTPTHHPRVGGTALFRETFLTGWLDQTQTRGLLFARGEMTSGIIVTSCDAKGAELMSIELLSSTGSIKPEFSDGKLSATVSVHALGNIAELHCDPRVHINELNERFAEAIKDEVRQAFDAMQKTYGIDAAGVGLTVYQNLPKVWAEVKDQWEEHFASLPIKIEVKAALRRQGLVSSQAEIH